MMKKWIWMAMLMATTMGLHAQPKFEYRLREPLVPTNDPPLLLMLHGYGSNEDDLFSFAPEVPSTYLVASLRAPLTLGDHQYAWYPLRFEGGNPLVDLPKAKDAIAYIRSFLVDLQARHPFDAGRIRLFGFSQGAIMSYAVALLHPGEIEGIAACSGRLLEEIKPDIPQDQQLASLKIFISHGTEDPVLRPQFGAEANAYLLKLGLYPVYKTYRAGHTILPANWKDLLAWLES